MITEATWILKQLTCIKKHVQVYENTCILAMLISFVYLKIYWYLLYTCIEFSILFTIKAN